MTDIPKDLIGGARKVVFEWRKKQAEPGVFPFLHAMIAEFVQTEIERVRIERDNLKVSIKSIQDGHTLAVELLAEALGKLEKAEKEENKATFRIFKSLAEALGHDVNLMRDEEIMEIDPYDEIRDLKTELEEDVLEDKVYGNEFVTEFLDSIETRKFKFAGDGESKAETTNDLPQGTQSPMTSQNKIPTPGDM